MEQDQNLKTIKNTIWGEFTLLSLYKNLKEKPKYLVKFDNNKLLS